MTEMGINAGLLTLVLFIAIAILNTRNLFSAVVMTGLFSLLCAASFVALDAVDVAFTEAAVGAGISTVLFLSALALMGKRAYDNTQVLYRSRFLGLFVSIATGAALLLAVTDMPAFGDANAPAHQHVAKRYIEQSGEETGLPNMVTSVLASYRGYDTMGETLVVFTAGIAVFGLLGNIKKRERDKLRRSVSQNDDIVLSVFSKLMTPMILLFALYVQFHGDFGPGGGFQAGVIFAAGLIIYALAFGIDELMLVLPPRFIRILMTMGIGLYAGTGVVTLLLGGNFLDYDTLAHGKHGQHYGIFAVELGVGISVSAVMLSLFYSFMNYRPIRKPRSQAQQETHEHG